MWQDPYGLLKDLQTVPGGNKALATDTLSFIKNVEGSKDNGWDVRQYSGPYGVKRGRDERLTPEQAEERLKGEVADVQATLDSKIKVPLSDNQRTALTSLFYNIGTDKGRVDQVADLINSGDIDKVPGWIKQYTRDRDGKYVPGLASRRAKEADLFAQAPAEDMAEGVTRSDLPSVEDVQRSNRYAGLSPERRRALITRTKIALSSVSQGEIKDDIERMLRGEEPEVGEDGLTSMERASKVLQPNQVKKFQQAWDDARLTRDAMVPMAGMGPVERQQHLASIDPDRPENKERLGASYRAAVKAQQRAERLDKAMSVLESQDPVEAVDPHRENEMRKAGLAKRASEVSNTYEMLRARNPNVRIDDDGTVTPLSPDAEDAARNVRVKILDARIDAQNERGIPDYASRTISKIEAKELLQLPDDVNKLTPKELREALTDAQTRVTNLYGPYAGTVMKDAIDLHIKKAPDADRKPIVERAVREAGRGAQTWTAIERDQRMKAADDQYPIVPYDQVQRLDKIESTLNPDVPVVPPAKPAKTRDWTKMSPDSQKRATDVLMQSFAKDPDAAQLFDRYFGQPGLAAKILKQGVPQP
jgi:GH24 family phage-related lysozyme (muramidase)